MNLTQYQIDAMSFRLPSSDATYALLNLPGEVGELLSLEAKLIRDGGNLTLHRDSVTKELGDILWCVAAIAADYKIDLQTVAEVNIHKLNSRKARNTINGSGDER
jgi:NTP pyrophosphatase (non-canonical NTP hydrolase)